MRADTDPGGDGPSGDDRRADPGGPPTEAAVRERLDRVTDPELDRSIVALEYVDEIRIDGGGADPGDDASAGDDGDDGPRAAVTVEFTLPTAWCSPAFAWMMATDARDEVEGLAGVAEARVFLREHMHDEEINRGVNRRQSFAETFPDADGGVEATRATLDDKARLARQFAAIEAVREAGLTPEQVVGLTAGDLAVPPAPTDDDTAEFATVYLRDRSLAVPVEPEPIRSYLRQARETGAVPRAPGADAPAGLDPDEPIFRTPEGDPIPPDEFELVRDRCRLARVNMGGQGGVCDALHEARQRSLADD
jgi:metal-sulfur cluster biosynthetic enzyme